MAAQILPFRRPLSVPPAALHAEVAWRRRVEQTAHLRAEAALEAARLATVEREQAEARAATAQEAG